MKNDGVNAKLLNTKVLILVIFLLACSALSR